MAVVTFEFRSRGAARVQRDMQRVIDSARNGASMLGRLNTGLASTAQQAQRSQRDQLLALGMLQRMARGAEREQTGAAREGSRARVRVAHDEARERARHFETLVRQHETAERRATRVTETEARRRIAANNRHQLGAARDNANANARDAARSRRSLGNEGRAALGAVRSGIERFGEYGDTVREQHARRRALEERAVQIGVDAGFENDPRMAADLLAATRREALRTGIGPEEILEGLSTAQANFSALATPEQRQAYLANILPTVLDAALSQNASVEHVVGEAGELQRQHGVTPERLAGQLAIAIRHGRSGSIAAGDFAQHLGVLGGGFSRFMGGEGAAGETAFATTSAMFQVAGQAGGGGDMAATRLRAFADNLSSARGQRRLRELLGRDALDERGQLRTEGTETQADALVRVFEEAYRRSGGNSERFLTGVAGVNTRARALGDQLFRDLAGHGGKAHGLRELLASGTGATAENTQGAGARAILATDAAAERRRQIEAMYAATQGPGGTTGHFAEETRRAMADLHRASPLAGFFADNALTRGAMDFFGMTTTAADFSRQVQTPEATTLRGLRHNMASRQAALELNEGTSGVLGTILGAVLPDSVRQSLLERTTARIEGRMVAGDVAAGRDLDAPLRIAPESISALVGGISGAVNKGSSPQATAVAAGLARGEATARAGRT